MDLLHSGYTLTSHVAVYRATFDQTVSKAPQTNKQSLWPLVRKRTVPIERLPLVGEF
jgi:hypothetical protein